MILYGISDLHLSFGVNKPMSVFGEVWYNHEDKIKQNWEKQAKNDDVIIVSGDISWGLDFKEAYKDFEFLNNLPGKKIILKGNHDYYFSTKTKVEKFLKENDFNTISVLYNNAIDTKKYIICGARGWSLTEETKKEDNLKIILREEGRLKISLDEGVKLKEEYEKNGIKKDIIVAMHFPPFVSNFQKILEEYNVKECIYGHLHGYGHSMVKEGTINGVKYIMVGCDYTGFKLIKL